MSTEKISRPRRTFTPEFKQQIADLYRSGKRKCDIIREYDIANSLLDKWIFQAEKSGSFREKDNRSPEEQELIALRKRNAQLEMENDILKQAALIMGRRKKSFRRMPTNILYQHCVTSCRSPEVHIITKQQRKRMSLN